MSEGRPGKCYASEEVAVQGEGARRGWGKRGGWGRGGGDRTRWFRDAGAKILTVACGGACWVGLTGYSMTGALG